MKRYFSILGIVTLSLILAAGCYMWLLNREQATALGFVPDEDWSKSFAVLPEIGLGIYDAALDKEGKLHMVYVDFDREEMIGKILYTGGIDQKGRANISNKVIVEKERLSRSTITIIEDKIYIFWLGQGDFEKYDLNVTTLDLNGHILEERKLLTDEFGQVKDLVSKAANTGKIMLVWTNLINDNVQQIKQVIINSSDIVVGKPIQISSSEGIATQPKIETDKYGHFHVIWKMEEKSLQDSVSTSDYFLCYQSFDQSGQALLEDPMIIDNIAPTEIGIAVNDDKLYFTWNKIVQIADKPGGSTLEKLFPNYMIYGTVLNLNEPESDYKIVRLTHQRGPTFNLDLAVDTGGLVHLLYIDAYIDELALTHEIYEDGFAGQIKAPRRLYPGQNLVPDVNLLNGIYRTFLFADSAKDRGIYCAWLDSDSAGYHIYYANTMNPTQISPLEVIGINRSFMGINVFMSLGFILGMPFVNMIGFLHLVFLVFISAFFIIIQNILRKTKFGTILNNPYIGWLLIAGIHFILQYKRLYTFFWPAHLTFSQQLFSFILATIGVLIFITLNRQKKGLYYAGINAVYWIYWMNVIGLMFILAQVNYA